MYRWLTRPFSVARFSASPKGECRWCWTRKLRLEPLEGRNLLAVILDLGGEQTLIPGDNINVSNDWEPDPSDPEKPAERHQSEMTLDVDPTNPLNLAGFSHRRNMAENETTGGNEIDVFHSQDGGATWATTRISHTDVDPDPNDNVAYIKDTGDIPELGEGKRFDPSIAFDADGNLFVAYGFRDDENDDDDDTGTDHLVVGRSTDGGASFQFSTVETRAHPKSLDKWHLATGPARVPAEDPQDPDIEVEAVYVAYVRVPGEGASRNRVVVAGSADQGATFDPGIQFGDANQGDVEIFPDPAVGPGGELYVSWLVLDNDPSAPGKIKVDVDRDGLWKNDHSFDPDDDPTATKLNAKMIRAGVEGSGNSPDYVRVPAQEHRGIINGPVLDVDRNTGRLYIAYADTKTTEELPETDPSPDPYPILDSDIFLIYSDDHGANRNRRTRWPRRKDWTTASSC